MWLLDGNVLVALSIDTHEFHERVERWFDSQSEPFATCAVTEGTLLRVHMKVAADSSAAGAWSVLEAIPCLCRLDGLISIGVSPGPIDAHRLFAQAPPRSARLN
jgi:predicted nucleic acid-binding protein